MNNIYLNLGGGYQKLNRKIEFITKPTKQKEQGIKVAPFRDSAGSLIEIYENIIGEILYRD